MSLVMPHRYKNTFRTILGKVIFSIFFDIFCHFFTFGYSADSGRFRGSQCRNRAKTCFQIIKNIILLSLNSPRTISDNHFDPIYPFSRNSEIFEKCHFFHILAKSAPKVLLADFKQWPMNQIWSELEKSSFLPFASLEKHADRRGVYLIGKG